ncbi:MAG TPA: group 1 truncated hemoglobin [Labilithrix sp.]|jgi:hemoglobin
MKTWIFMGAATLAILGVACGSSSSDASMNQPNESPSSSQSSLYERLGSHDGIAKAVDAIVAEELKDPEIASYFFFQVQSPLPAGHPSADQIKECLVAQLGAASGGPEKYPATTSTGFQCRSMTAAHAKLGIPDGVFTKFLTIAAGVLKTAGVMDADIQTVGGVLEGARGDVAQDHSRQDGMFVPPKQ